jgi:hypothetical protein
LIRRSDFLFESAVGLVDLTIQAFVSPPAIAGIAVTVFAKRHEHFNRAQ